MKVNMSKKKTKKELENYITELKFKMERVKKLSDMIETLTIMLQQRDDYNYLIIIEGLSKAIRGVLEYKKNLYR
ncbi:MAG: hypothetical protein ACTSVB_05500 [Candidatus Heimdallarchaeaceae archaeon]